MPYNDEHLSLGPSVRDVAAAWMFCGFVVLGAFLAAPGGKRVNSSMTSHAGVQIPSHSGWSAPDISPAGGLDDLADGFFTAYGTTKEPSCCSASDIAEYTALPTETSEFMPARSRC